MSTSSLFLVFQALFVVTAMSAQVPEHGGITEPVLPAELRPEVMFSFQLAPSGWSRSVLMSGPVRMAKQQKKGTPEATVEVWDFEIADFPHEQFRLFRIGLFKDLSRSLRSMSLDYGGADLGLFMSFVAEHGNAAGLDMMMVQALQNRFNNSAMPNSTNSGGSAFIRRH